MPNLEWPLLPILKADGCRSWHINSEAVSSGSSAWRVGVIAVAAAGRHTCRDSTVCPEDGVLYGVRIRVLAGFAFGQTGACLLLAGEVSYKTDRLSWTHASFYLGNGNTILHMTLFENPWHGSGPVKDRVTFSRHPFIFTSTNSVASIIFCIFK